MKAGIAFAFAFALPVVCASEDVMVDEGLSLLQLRAQPAVEEYQGPKYVLGAAGTDCAPEEDITWAMCLEAQVKQMIPNTIAAWGLIYNQRSGSFMQRGCFMIGGNIYFSDEPITNRLRPSSRTIKPICSKQGGFDAYIAMAGISCRQADCQHKPDANIHTLNWGDGVVVPELMLGEPGGVCEACGILDYAQCSKAGDTGLIEAIYGKRIDFEFSTQCSGGGHSRPAMPSGCSVSVQLSHQVNFCPYDTPDGALAGLVSDSGAGVGFGRIRPVCGVCTTTTTTPEPLPEADSAEAVGDPHMRTNSNNRFDLD